MSKRFVKFPSIEQFRKAIEHVTSKTQYSGRDENNKPMFDTDISLPTIEMRGTVKLHGTNAGVGFSEADGIWAQSRNMILEQNDSFGFRQFVLERKDTFKDLGSSLPHSNDQIVCVFGEFCGKGIQKGVALQQLPKMFVVFAACVVGHLADKRQKEDSYDDDDDARTDVFWLPEKDVSKLKSPENLIYNIYDFPTWTVSVDFNDPAIVQEKLAEITNAVEQQCPVAHALGADGIGEGVVWTAQHEKVGKVCFKVKGEKHAVVKSKSAKAVPVDVEKVESVRAFVEYALPENRLLQAVEQVFTVQGETASLKKMRDFIAWVNADIKKEESDTLKKNKLQESDVCKEITAAARNWLVQYCKTAQ